MNYERLKRLALWLVAVGAPLAATATVGSTLTVAACGDSSQCDKVRDQTFAQKQIWEVCEPNALDPCIKAFGNVKDCSGVLSCDFAINPMYRQEAEQAVLTIAQQTQ